MDWIFLVISSVCFVGIFMCLGASSRIKKFKKIITNVASTIRSSRISDHWKEKVLPRYSLQLFSHSLLIFGVLVASFSPFVVFSVFSTLLGGQFVELAASLKGGVASTIVAISFAMLIPQKSGENYGAGSRFLHQIVLGSPFLGEAIFDLERLLYGSKVRDVSAENHVFVAGLARAGTTILMKKLYENGQFCSLTYRDMPFILAPNTWRTLSTFSNHKAEKQERAHGDGLKVDYDSPEALEEIFWRIFCGSDYIKKKCLAPMSAGDETVEKFRSFIALLLKDKKDKCYLSKNNNNILRLNSISRAFPNALIVVPFREPLQQAFSLLNQHQRFIQKDSEDPFTRKYMTWLVHHEFGADHRPFLFDKSIDVNLDTNNLSYWVRVWLNTYSYLLENLPTQAICLSYESLCDDTEYVWGKISERANLIPYNETISLSKSLHQIDESLPQNLMLQSTELYNKLVAKSIDCR